MNNTLFFLFMVCINLLNRNASAEAPTNPTASAPIYEFITKDIAKGIYSFRFTTPEKTVRQESGYLDHEGSLVVNGYYSYLNEKGEEYYVSYYADKNGYHIATPDDAGNVNYGVPPALVASLLG